MNVLRNTRVDHYFEKHLRHLAGLPDLRFCQIGVYMGDMTLWLLDNILTHESCTLDDVDAWIEGYDGWTPEGVEAVYQERMEARDELYSLYSQVKTHNLYSADFFAFYPTEYDFIYVDADHTSEGVLMDARNAWRHLKSGGIIAFDDTDREDTQRGVNAFLSAVDGYFLLERGLQTWIQKS